MIASIEVAVLYSIFIVTGTTDCDIPDVSGKMRVAATSDCITIGCQPDSEGNTVIQLAPVGEIDPGTKPTFVGRIRTPNRKIQAWSALWELLLEIPTVGDETTVYVWLNHPTFADEVKIGIA
jgi:hypothetical protein